jgi:hypothetical protein
MLAAAAMNFKRMMNIWKNNLWQLFYQFILKFFCETKSHSALFAFSK